MSLEQTAREMAARYQIPVVPNKVSVRRLKPAGQSWKDGVPPFGAISGRAPDVPAQVPTRSRRTGVERLELVAAGFGGAVALALLLIVEKKVTGRG